MFSYANHLEPFNLEDQMEHYRLNYIQRTDEIKDFSQHIKNALGSKG